MKIEEHMEIVGSEGKQVGTVDSVEGERIKLTKADTPKGFQGLYHYIDIGLVDAVEGNVVRLAVESDAVPFNA